MKESVRNMSNLKHCIFMRAFGYFKKVKNAYGADHILTYSRFIQASLCKIQGLFKDFFQGLKTYIKYEFTH